MKPVRRKHVALLAQVRRQIGRRVRKERQRRGLTQEQFAERLGCSANFVAHLERGSRGASLGTLLRIAMGLEVPLASLFAADPQEG